MRKEDAIVLAFLNESAVHWFELSQLFRQSTEATQVLTAEENAIFLLSERMKLEVQEAIGKQSGLAGELLAATLYTVDFDKLAIYFINQNEPRPSDETRGANP